MAAGTLNKSQENVIDMLSLYTSKDPKSTRLYKKTTLQDKLN